MLERLKQQVCRANKELARRGLVMSTWGNVSAIDRATGRVAIKPSGVAVADLRLRDIAILDLDGVVLEGNLKPSTDTPSHLEIYKAWPQIGSVVHTHSLYGTMFAQAMQPIPCLGTTHADYFRGDIPVTRELSSKELAGDYERNTGLLIVRCFRGLNPLEMPGVLVARHAPFAWGKSLDEAVDNAEMLELMARLAHGTYQLDPDIDPAPTGLVNKHYLRKHGVGAYYGQKPVRRRN